MKTHIFEVVTYILMFWGYLIGTGFLLVTLGIFGLVALITKLLSNGKGS
jgi:hypothetical protein